MTPSAVSSDNMLDYCAPTIRSERPKAPARRIPKSRAKRRGTIEFMASFLISGRKSSSEDDSTSSSKCSNPRNGSDYKPACPNRRGTMEHVWGSLKHMSIRSMRDVQTSEPSSDNKPIRPNRRGTMEFFRGSKKRLSTRNAVDETSGETEMPSADLEE